MFEDRITVLAGHFGSGKTEIAIAGAISLAEKGVRPVLVDLDVVKPYFRSRAARDILAEAGVDLVAPEGDDIYSDLPIIMPAVRTVCANTSKKVIIDVGGDDTGARALGSISDVLRSGDVAFDIVLNFRSPFTSDVDSAVAMTREIESAAKVKMTGVVSNTHLMHETTPDVVRKGYEMAVETSRRLGVKVVAVVVEERLANEVGTFDCELLVLRRVIRPPFEAYTVRKNGPIFQLC